MKPTALNCNRCRELARTRLDEALDPQAAEALDSHLAACAGCRDYAAQLDATTTLLTRLAGQPVAPSAALRRRWTQAVKRSPESSGLAGWLIVLAERSWWWLQANRRPLLALSPVWLALILLRALTPDLKPPSVSALSRSPIEIFRVLQQETQLLARESSREQKVEMPPEKVPAAPRSGAATPYPEAGLFPGRPARHLILEA